MLYGFADKSVLYVIVIFKMTYLENAASSVFQMVLRTILKQASCCMHDSAWGFQ